MDSFVGLLFRVADGGFREIGHTGGSANIFRKFDGFYLERKR